MRGRCSGLTKLFCSIRTKPPRIIPRRVLIVFKAKPNDAASANEIIAEAEASLRADPSFARAYLPMAVGESLLGHYEQAISDLEQAMRISPRDSSYRNLAHGNGQSVSWRCVDTMRRSRKASRPSTRGIARFCLTLRLAAFYAAADKTAGGESRAGGGDEIESQTLLGVVSRAHPFLYRHRRRVSVKP